MKEIKARVLEDGTDERMRHFFVRQLTQEEKGTCDRLGSFPKGFTGRKSHSTVFLFLFKWTHGNFCGVRWLLRDWTTWALQLLLLCFFTYLLHQVPVFNCLFLILFSIYNQIGFPPEEPVNLMLVVSRKTSFLTLRLCCCSLESLRSCNLNEKKLYPFFFSSTAVPSSSFFFSCRR